MLDDRAAERLALGGVPDGDVERRLRETDGDRADAEPAGVEGGEGDRAGRGPRSPTSRSAGIGTSSRRTAAVVEPVRPIFSSGRAAPKPGRSGVRWKQEMPRSPSSGVRRKVE